MKDTSEKALMYKFFSDKSFRSAVLKDPGPVLRSHGFKPSKELLEKFKNADKDAVEAAVASVDAAAEKNYAC